MFNYPQSTGMLATPLLRYAIHLLKEIVQKDGVQKYFGSICGKIMFLGEMLIHYNVPCLVLQVSQNIFQNFTKTSVLLKGTVHPQITNTYFSSYLAHY